MRSGTTSESAMVSAFTMVWVMALRPTTGAGGSAFTTEFDFDAAVLAISMLIVFASLVILWLIQKSVELDVMLRSGGSG